MEIMIFALEILDVAAIEPLLVSIPESVSLLAFGVGLVSVAVILRWILGRNDDDKTRRKLSE